MEVSKTLKELPVYAACVNEMQDSLIMMMDFFPDCYDYTADLTPNAINIIYDTSNSATPQNITEGHEDIDTLVQILHERERLNQYLITKVNNMAKRICNGDISE